MPKVNFEIGVSVQGPDEEGLITNSPEQRIMEFKNLDYNFSDDCLHRIYCTGEHPSEYPFYSFIMLLDLKIQALTTYSIRMMSVNSDNDCLTVVVPDENITQVIFDAACSIRTIDGAEVVEAGFVN